MEIPPPEVQASRRQNVAGRAGKAGLNGILDDILITVRLSFAPNGKRTLGLHQFRSQRAKGEHALGRPRQHGNRAFAKVEQSNTFFGPKWNSEG